MSSVSRVSIATLLMSLALVTVISGAAFAAPSASLEQVRNGPLEATTTPVPVWVSGNAGASNSHYLESHSIAYRAIMDQLPTDGTVIEMVVGYNVKRSDSYALDYLSHYQRLLPHVLFGHRDPEVIDPLDGVTGVGPTVTTAPIPLLTKSVIIDPDGPASDPAAPQPITNMSALPDAERLMTLFGGTLLDVSYVVEGDVDLATSSSETQVMIRFTADSPKAVLAWGGHIASRWDYGFHENGSPRSAGGIRGSSYHMRLVDWNLDNLGNQDRSMSTDAVYPVPRCMISNPGPFCAGATSTHTAPSGMESYTWTLFDNTAGAYIIGDNTGLSVVVHAPASGSYGLMLTTTASGFSKDCSTVVTVLAPAFADAGGDLVVCSSAPQAQLSGFVSGGLGNWSGGSGTFSPSPGDLNAIYTPSAAEIAAGGVTLTLTCIPELTACPPISDEVHITIEALPIANAGSDQAVCASSPQAQLSGFVDNGNAIWSGGNGTFNPNPGDVSAVYTPSADEIVAGGVTLTLTSTPAGSACPPVSDDVYITIDPLPVANAGPDQTVCASEPQVQLSGFVDVGSANWSGGSGSFSPNPQDVSAIYTLSAAEIAAGGVTLTLTSIPAGSACPPVSDDMHITIDALPIADAGPDQTVCASAPQVQLAGSVSGSVTGGTWSGGAGTFSPSITALNAIYTPTAGEIADGSIVLTLTTDEPSGPCPAVSDQMLITINPSAMADAGPDQIVCASSAEVQLAGAIGGGAANGAWSGGAGKFTPNASVLDATYMPTAAEIAAGSVTLVLTASASRGPCPTVSDEMTITIDPITIVDAGPDQTVCSSSPQTELDGSVSGVVSGGTWSGGDGSFSPGATSLNATYTPTAAEIAAGEVTLVLTSATSTRPCPPASDAMTIFITPEATVDAGEDQIVCAVSPQLQLSGSVGSGATSGTWSGGNGTFNPGASSLNATYTPTAQEIASGSVTLTLTTNDPPGPCPAVSDEVKLTYSKPTVSVPNRIVCEGVDSATICANPGGGVSPYTYEWSTGETTRCIEVSEPGDYHVTIIDALGCEANGSGSFGWRDCIGELTHTSVTCETYQSGTGDALEAWDINMVIKDNIITSIAPGVFFYYTKISAPTNAFTVDIVQAKTSNYFPFLPVLHDQVVLYDSDCGTLGTGIETGPGQASVGITGAEVGEVFIIRVKYSLKELVGYYLDPANGVHYDFRTEINGQIVDQDPDGLQIGSAALVGIGDDPYQDLDGPPILRPVPNPFRDHMQMAYKITTPQENVSIRIYDVAGRLVRTLVSGAQPAGLHVAKWDGRTEQGMSVRQGVYFVHTRIGDEKKQVRVTFLR